MVVSSDLFQLTGGHKFGKNDRPELSLLSPAFLRIGHAKSLDVEGPHIYLS